MMTTNTQQNFKAALIQLPFGTEKPNVLQLGFDHLESIITEAANTGAQLIVLPELCNSKYFCQTIDDTHFDLAETIPGPSTKALSILAKEQRVVIVAPLFERTSNGIFHNTVAVIDIDGSIAGCYRKMHIPNDPGYYEQHYFTPGEQGFIPIKTSLGQLGILICWDQWFPEAARIMTLNGADCLIYPTAIGWDPRDTDTEKERQLQAWINIQRAHAIANTTPVLVCNRVGFEKDPSQETAGIKFWGHSFVVGPFGEWTAQAEDATSQLICADIDLEGRANCQQVWPFFRDRRIDAYGDILKTGESIEKNPKKWASIQDCSSLV